MSAEERWKTVHERLKKLQEMDCEDEAKLIHDAYDSLLVAYQEARSLNMEMEEMTAEVMVVLHNAGIVF